MHREASQLVVFCVAAFSVANGDAESSSQTSSIRDSFPVVFVRMKDPGIWLFSYTDYVLCLISSVLFVYLSSLISSWS